MNNVALMIMIGTATTLASGVICRPHWLGDSNEFLRDFVNHEYLNTLGVILAITLASLAQAHLSLNSIEEKRGNRMFDSTREEMRSNALWLIWLFVIGVVVVMVKPLIHMGETGAAAVNSVAIVVLVFYVLILADITSAIFDIRADVKNDNAQKGDQGR